MFPSLIKSVLPDATTTHSSFFATSITISLESAPSSNESTPFPFTFKPPKNWISDIFPLTTSNLTSFNNLFVISVLAFVANTPTGSNITGLLYLFAALPAKTYKSSNSLFIVPILITTEFEILTISSTSSYEKLIKGLAPMASVVFAQSVIVTLFV